MATTYNILSNTGKIFAAGYWPNAVLGSTPVIRGTGNKTSGGGAQDWDIEFVFNGTQLDMHQFSSVNGAYSIAIDGAAPISINGVANITTVVNVVTGLSAGNHLVQIKVVDTSAYIGDFIVTGGTEALVSVAKRQYYYASNVGGNAPTETSLLTLRGARSNGPTNQKAISTGSYGGLITEFQFTGTGVLLFAVPDNGTFYAVSVDGGAEVLAAAGSALANGGWAAMPIVSGLAAGTHTIKITHLNSQNTARFFVNVIILNGTATTGSSLVGATTLTVASAAGLAVGDWVSLDVYPNREVRQITAIAGSVITVAALTYAHAAGASVDNYKDAQGTVTAWSSLTPAKKLVVMGDSVTQGASTSGLVNFSQYDPRNSFIYRACQLLGWEAVNLGIQGRTSGNLVTNAADLATYAWGADYWAIFIGINDANSNVSTATYQANLTSLLATAKATYPGKIGLVVKLFSPTNYIAVNNGAGYKVADYNAIINTVVAAAAADGYSIITSDLSTTFAAANADMADALHPLPSGQIKLAAQLAALLGAPIASSGGGGGLLTPQYPGRRH